MMTEMELILLALNNYRNRRVINREEQNKVFVFYMKNLHKKGFTVELYFAFLKEEVESMCHGAELSTSEKSQILRKVKEYLSQAEKRVRKSRQ